MRALLKNSRKIVITNIDPSERALIDEFIHKSAKKATLLKALYDIDNELDGASFELTGKKPGLVNYRTPCIQVVAADGVIQVDLKVDSDTSIEIDPLENEGYLTVSLDDNNIISIKALYREDLLDTTGQYIVTAVLSKEGCETTIVPINVAALYITSSGTGGTRNYERLENKPTINNVVLLGNKTLEDFGMQEEMEDVTDSEIDDLFNF